MSAAAIAPTVAPAVGSAASTAGSDQAKANGAHLSQPSVQVHLQRPTATAPARPQAPAAPIVAEAAAPQPSPAAIAAAAIVQATPKPKSPTATPAAAIAATSSGRSLEDTVSDLLRPMLREWLDKNMPGLVEKALRSEIKSSDGSGH